MTRGWVSALAALALVLSGALVTEPAQADSPVVTVTVAPVDEEIESGARAVFRISYACSTLVGFCTGVVVTADPPPGVQPGTGEAVPNVDVASATGGDAVALVFSPLAGGTSGEVQVSWVVPNPVTLPGTEVSQSITLAADGQDTATVTSAPLAVTATPQLAAQLAMLDPTDETAVVVDRPVTYRVYDCNPGATGLGALGSSTVTLTLTLPTGAVVDPASVTGGGVVSGDTVTWTATDPIANGCDLPERAYDVTVTYPSAVFQPPPANPPAVFTRTPALHVEATALDATVLTADDTVTHTFVGRSANDNYGSTTVWRGTSGSDWAAPRAISRTNTTEIYDWRLYGYWTLSAIGPQPWPDRYNVMVHQSRIPCVVGSTAISPNPTGTDPLVGNVPGDWSVPANQCQTPGFEVLWLNLDEYSASKVTQVEVVTWNGSAGTVYKWNPSGPIGGALDLAVHAVPDVRGPTLVGGDAPDLGGESETGEAASAPALGSGDGRLVTGTVDSLGVPAGEIVTDVRIVYDQVDYYNQVMATMQGRSTPAFATSGATQMFNKITAITYNGGFAWGTTPPPVANWFGGTDFFQYVRPFIEPAPDPVVTKTAVDPVSALAPGDTPQWRVRLANGFNGTPLNPYLVEVLPPGHTLVPESLTWTNLEMLDGVQLDFTSSTVVIDGVERTALTFSWAPEHVMDNPNDETSPDHQYYVEGRLPTLELRTQLPQAIADGTRTGNEANLAYLFDGVVNLPVLDGAPVDEFDLDEDGITAERVARASVDWTAVGTAGVIAELFVRAGGATEWTKAAAIDDTWRTDAAPIEYRIQVANRENYRVNDFVLYDVFPFIGDHGLSAELSGDPRGTEWEPVFTGVTSVPDFVELAYSTSTTPCTPELFDGDQGTCVDDWTTTPPADLASVRALRATVTEPYEEPDVDNPPLTIDYGMEVPVPADVALLAVPAPAPGESPADANVAWQGSRVNSAGEVVDLLRAESAIARVSLIAGGLSGVVWHDVDRDGLREDGEPPIAGVPVELLDETGEPVVGPAGAVVTLTDDSGAWAFEAPMGRYLVRFPTATDGLPLTVQRSAEALGSDPAADGVAGPYDVTAAAPLVTGIDAGYGLVPAPGPAPASLPSTGVDALAWAGPAGLLVLLGLALARSRRRSAARP
ncbi:SdrD B-like domain-containing protein [Agromyces sp. G08B096]|uniref:SdrD B-like domain-containing protein n=1 Tax=Agromyces sp. G08B096 TaxID=3156399 RepID=A0AAU7W8R5_9MICO